MSIPAGQLGPAGAGKQAPHPASGVVADPAGQAGSLLFVTAPFSPPTATIGGRPVLTLTAAPSSAAGAFAVTVTALTLSSDPIGTSAPLGLTISAP